MQLLTLNTFDCDESERSNNGPVAIRFLFEEIM